MEDMKTLPKNPYGKWKTSTLMMDEDLQHDILTHLQSLGPFVSAQSIVEFTERQDIQDRLQRSMPISLKTA